MSNVLEPHKQEEILALGRLGWTLTRIGRATGVHRVTVGSTFARRASDPQSGSACEGPMKPTISGKVRRRVVDLLGFLGAPTGFEPGMDVLQI
jgi:hypothetical protein